VSAAQRHLLRLWAEGLAWVLPWLLGWLGGQRSLDVSQESGDGLHISWPVQELPLQAGVQGRHSRDQQLQSFQHQAQRGIRLHSKHVCVWVGGGGGLHRSSPSLQPVAVVKQHAVVKQ
jgi:hypothetical protein